jgi:hypothetical protein
MWSDRNASYFARILLWTFVLSLGSKIALAENIDPADDGSRHAYGENVGWVNAKPGGDGGLGVQVGDTALTGYLWAENVGWISLSCLNMVSCFSVDYGVANNGAGVLSGYAWGENVGWLNFGPEGGGVGIDPVTGDFGGTAWGENIGWVTFSADSPVAYKVKTDWRAPTCTLAGDLDRDCDVDSDDLNILLSYRNQLAASCPGCDLDGDGTITALDSRKLVLLCTRSRCATA